MKKIICDCEYKSLRDELISRNSIINSQASTAVVTIISAWAAAFTFRMSIMSEQKPNLDFSLEKINDDEYRISADFDIYEEIQMRFLSAAIFIIPILFFVPLAVKSGENLIQIASISTYIRIFYEYPTMEKKKSWNWESANNLLSNANVDRKKQSFAMKFFNLEYTILSICSFLIFIFFSVIDFNQIYNQYVLRGKIRTGDYVICVFAGIILTILAIVSIFFIYRNSCMKYTLMSATEKYLFAYIEVARKRKIITEKQVEDAKQKMNPRENIFI